MNRIYDHQSVLLPAAYIGPIHYFALVRQARTVFIESGEHYIKQTWRNRCLILTANGVYPLTIPVIKIHGNHTKIKDILISYREKWQQIHWRAISSAYRNSPFFLFYADELEKILFSKEEKLLDLNLRLTDALLKMMKISVALSVTEQYETCLADDVLDLRNQFTSGKQLTYPFPPYMQVFDERFGFVPGLSIIDLLFNIGPDAADYLNRLTCLSSRDTL